MIGHGPPVCALVGGAAAMNTCGIRPACLWAAHSRLDPAAHLLSLFILACIQHTPTAMHPQSLLTFHITDIDCCVLLALVSVDYVC